ncbi:DUF2535 family protein [Cytobacillus sp. FSL K6-0265]|uniref:DUF2535 family protein n=2 Tax=Cytobacillus TaxID=2675230 RepID=UPI0030F98AA3
MMYNTIKRVKMRIDILICKSLEFRNVFGQKVKITDIPLVDKGSPCFFLVHIRLQQFVTKIYHMDHCKTTVYSFKEYLKRVMKWSDVEMVFQTKELKSNA